MDQFIHSNNIYSIFSFVIIHSFFISFIQCDCTQSPIIETMYVRADLYCNLVFDPCSNYSLTKCSLLNCPENQQTCQNISKLSNAKSCKTYCCDSSTSNANSLNAYSVQLCKADAYPSYSLPTSPDSGPFVGGYILIAVIGSAFIIIFLIFCFCRRRNQQNLNTNGQNANNQDPNVLPSTCVDLNAYDINQQGPYFVNSNDSCAICLDKQVNLRTHCNHYYHGNCLLAWLKKKPNNPCPLCMGIKYNPVKVYCQQCHCGDKLVNIEPSTSQNIIKEYDLHKCQNCKRNIGNQSFTFSDEKNNKSENEQRTKNNTQNKKEVDSFATQQISIQNQQKLSHRSKRRRRKIESLKKIQNQQTQKMRNRLNNTIENSAKKLNQNLNNTIGP